MDISHSLSLKRLLFVLICATLVIGCGNGGGSGEQTREPQTALVVGTASGAVYQELASKYVIQTGDGSESSDGYDLLIYGQSVTADELETFPTTVNFLSSGKVLIVLAPSEDDRQALESLLGATALVDGQAVAVFNAYSPDGNLQTTTMVEFPSTSNEDPIQTDPPGSASTTSPDLAVTNLRAIPDETALRAQTDQWVALYESKHAEATQTMGALTGVSPAQFAAAAIASPTASADSATGGTMDIVDFIAPSQEITPAANGSQFLTVQPFFEFTPRTLISSSIYVQERFKNVYPHSVFKNTAILKGLCPYWPSTTLFDIPNDNPVATNVNLETATYRMLKQVNRTYAHEIIVRQYILSSPSITKPPEPIGTEEVKYCQATVHNCGATKWCCNAIHNPFCGVSFTVNWPLSSLRGYNEQVSSTLSWDETTSSLLTLDGLLPAAANNVRNVTTSSVYSRTVSWSIQGGLEGASPRNVGVNLGGNGGEMHTWTWGTAETMNMPDWQMESNGLPPGPASTYNFFASNGPNSLANLKR
jgi:hypothetical protein